MAVKRFLLIRHGKTQGNLERRYIGDMSEPLCGEGIREAEILARSGLLPPITRLISGSAVRCRQTAKLLFPDMSPKICALAEIDFGVFKGKNADDLTGNKDYETWLGTGCMGDIPGGGSVSAFKERCCETFDQIAKTGADEITALVIHGGNIMAIMEKLALPKRNFYTYQLPNCGFFLCRYESGALHVEREGKKP